MINKIAGLFKATKPSSKLFKKQFKTLKKQEASTLKRFDFDKIDLYPCLNDATTNTGFDRHYIYHPAWAARIINSYNPEKHVDISSTLHFCSILSAFIPVDFYDYRPANLSLSNLKSLPGDVLNLPFADRSISSISCMHTIEHIGLGRYNDPLDYDGDIKAVAELKRVLAEGGNLLFVVPLGNRSKIQFNAHRIYTKDSVLSLFNELTLKEFALIPEDETDGGLVVNPDDALLAKQIYGCGCFWFQR
jgi:SAM-dependent methyltransferase